MKVKTYKFGTVYQDDPTINGMVSVKLYKGSEIFDKVSCDTKKQAGEYFRAFCKIAKNL